MGFGLDWITVPVSVWHGTHDGNLSSAHGIWLSEHIPGARAHIIDGEGHISLILRIEQILGDLLACWPAGLLACWPALAAVAQ